MSAAVPLLVLLIILGSDYWVYTDAKALAERGTPVVFSTNAFSISSPGAWVVGCLFLWIVFFPLYFVTRNQTR